MSELPERLRAELAQRYRIENEIGAGGMASVFLAHDLRHNRLVALKVMRPELTAAIGKDRFLREIALAAQLQHPHILPLIDSGEVDGILYYIMPYVNGETLRQRLLREGTLPVSEALRLTIEVADALGSAHRRGVVHRDVKPENILLHENHALVADFGIALAIQQPGDERLTQTGVSLGTPTYMSPEQIDGARDIDERSDIYSLGCVLFEMLVGRPPFDGPTPHAILAKHLVAPTPELSDTKEPVSELIRDALRGALAKDPAARFPTASAFASALSLSSSSASWVSSTAPPPTATLAVLPFDNASPEAVDSIFATGLTDEVISDLSKVKAIRVISRNSSMRLKGTTKDLKTIGRDLGVRYILTGSVRRAGASLRITAELVDTASDTVIWGDKYSGTVSDVFDLQETLARQIVDALRVTVTPEESRRLAARAVDDIRVFERVARARELVYSYEPEALRTAKALLHEALAQAGDNATVFGWLAVVNAWSLLLGASSGSAAMAIADAYAQNAIALGGDSAHPYWAKGIVEFMQRGPHISTPIIREAVARERSADNLIHLAYGLSLIGRAQEAAALAAEAVARDPLTPTLQWYHAWILMRVPLTEEAAAAARAVVRPDFLMGEWAAGITLCYAGRRAEGLSLLERVPAGDNAPLLLEWAPIIVGSLRDGRPPQPSERLLEWTKTGDPFGPVILAGMYAHVGDREGSLRWMRFAIDRGVVDDEWWADTDPFVAPLRGDPEFRDLVSRARSLRVGAADSGALLPNTR